MAVLVIRNTTDKKKIEVPLTKDTTSIGRGQNCDIRLNKPSVSDVHFQILRKDGVFYVMNLSMGDGTVLDGQKITAPAQLKHGAVIHMSDFDIIFQDDHPSKAQTPVRPDAPCVDIGKMIKQQAHHKHEESVAHTPPPQQQYAQYPQQGSQYQQAPPQQMPQYPQYQQAPPPPQYSAPAVMPAQPIAIQWRDNFIRLPVEMLKRVHQRLIEDLDLKHMDMSKYSNVEVRQRTAVAADRIVSSLGGNLPPQIPRELVVKQIVDEALGLGPLEDLVADPQVDEIMVNGAFKIYVEVKGKIVLTQRQFVDDDHVLAVIRRIVSPLGRRIDESSPMVDGRLADGSRVNAIIHPVCISGPTITIRKFAKTPFTAEDLIIFGTYTREMMEFCKLCVKNKKNILISGGTGSGKTTLLNVVSSAIPLDERIVTIEDAAELKLPQEHIISLEAKPPNIEGEGAVPIRKLVINALRMRPDRIIVGECRGGEALDMLQAMNTGHDGSLTTVHANSARDAIARIETMVLMAGMDLPSRAITIQIASAIHVIIHTARLTDGKRRVTSISAITGMEGNVITMQEVFMFDQTGYSSTGQIEGSYKATGAIPKFVHDLRKRGSDVDMSIFGGSNG
ncbi:MAG: Flp pilus assembly complex ATPase component TadA [Planctomycetes bacterium]|nr:Flp pilus assembly complex ATPase component TadA [Planctomycetota bacterium]